MKIWAISDLHLGLSTGKWMGIFGPHWEGHHLKVEAAWREAVGQQDIVLVAGDLSWAMRPGDVQADLAWLSDLPGTKVLVKGNHDYWWPGTQARLAALLPRGVYAIKKRAIVIQGIPIIGVRGADFLVREGETHQEVEARLIRERGELLQSIDDLRRFPQVDRRPICLFHYPPFPIGRSESFFTRILEDTGCSNCVYGHLHTVPEHQRVFQGEQRGVRYSLVSCDYLDFRPLLLSEATEPVPAADLSGESTPRSGSPQSS